MKGRLFHSLLTKPMRRFVALRRMEGKEYRSQTERLIYFDRFLVSKNWKHRWITREIIDAYRLSRTHLVTSSRGTMMSVVRQFCRYWALFEPRCYIPPAREWSRGAHDRPVPFVFTKAQVCCLLRAAAQLRRCPSADALRPHLYQTLFGLLYTTGIRIGEALALNVGDIQLPTRRLLVRNGKFGKARWIPLSPSTASRLEGYLVRRSRISPVSEESPLFLSLRGQRLTYGSVQTTFQFVLRACGLAHQDRAGPKIHSLRHTFACHRLLAWYREGVDINARLPALSTYMGHSHVQFTHWYLHATPELLNETNQRFLTHYRKTIKPEVAHE